MSDYSEICRQLRLKPCLCQPVNRTCIKCKAAEALEALQARVRELERTSSVLSKTERECHTLQDWRMRALDLEAQWSRCSQACARLQTERDALRAKLEALEAHKAAKAAIDLELGMPEDGCNNTQATLTAIRLLHSAHRDDVGANNRLVAFLSESVRMIEGYMRAGWLTNPAAREQATDFIQRARLAYSAPPTLPENK